MPCLPPCSAMSAPPTSNSSPIPSTQSLHLETVHGKRGRIYYSVCVGLHYRALAGRLPDTWLWFWIGPHAEYDKLLQ
jgi:hypothetical protein